MIKVFDKFIQLNEKYNPMAITTNWILQKLRFGQWTKFDLI